MWRRTFSSSQAKPWTQRALFCQPLLHGFVIPYLNCRNLGQFLGSPSCVVYTKFHAFLVDHYGWITWILWPGDQRDQLSKDVRAPEDHAVIAWANLTTVGVMPAAKYDWFLTSLSNLLANHKRNSIGVIIHCNRASDPNRTNSFYVFVSRCARSQIPNGFMVVSPLCL